MLVVRGLCVSFGDRDLLSDVSFEIARGERVALLGDNGCGKSTLLRILAGEPGPGRSGVLRYEEFRRVAYVAQAPMRTADALSSGQRMRRRIQDALGRQPDLLLLDEPTNHLDAEGLAWLEAALRAFTGAVLFACHDRAFVEAMAGRVLFVTQGRLRSFAGGWVQFAQQIAAEAAAQRHQHDSWRRERERVRESALRQRNWAEKAHRDAGERNPSAKRRAAKLMHKAIATERRVARLEQGRVEKPWEEKPLSFSFLAPRDLPSLLVRAQDVAFTYEGGHQPAFGPVSFDLRRGERLALVGANGSGKTTLLMLLASFGRAADRPAGRMLGRLTLNPSTRLHFQQQEDPLPMAGTALGAMLSAGAPDAAMARTLLGHFHLRGDAALQEVSRLSPGERVRLQICCCLVRGADILLLDEPTNHLDLSGRQALESALLSYPGTVVFVSHDRQFRDRVATRSLHMQALERPARRASPIERDLMQMRLAELSARVGSLGPSRRRAAQEEMDRLVAALREHSRGDADNRE